MCLRARNILLKGNKTMSYNDLDLNRVKLTSGMCMAIDLHMKEWVKKHANASTEAYNKEFKKLHDQFAIKQLNVIIAKYDHLCTSYPEIEKTLCPF